MTDEIFLIFIAFIANEYLFSRIVEFRKLKAKIYSDVIFYSNLITNPLNLSAQNSELVIQQYHDASRDLRKSSSEMRAFVSAYKYLFIRPRRGRSQRFLEVSKNLMALSNSLFTQNGEVHVATRNDDLLEKIKTTIS